MTDQTASTDASFTYDAYGNTTQAGTSDIGQQYTGREVDGTGLIYYRARYYSPGLQRFVSKDSVGWASGQSNPYEYVHSHPLNATDPTGQGAEMFVVPVLAACVIIYCAKRTRDDCARKFPDHTNPESSDYAPYARCQSALVSVCGLGFFAVDPPGATAAELGAAAAKKVNGDGDDE